eukprot:3579732-Amphidinium_carterae.1
MPTHGVTQSLDAATGAEAANTRHSCFIRVRPKDPCDVAVAICSTDLVGHARICEFEPFPYHTKPAHISACPNCV